MNITSIQFAFFALLALIIYYLLPKRPQHYWLLFVSYIFLVTWDWQFGLVLATVTTINFLIARWLRVDYQGQRGWLWFGITLNVLILLFFRSADFFLPELEGWLNRLGISTHIGGLQILMPLGLSYYVLQAISYLVDVYRGQLKTETDFVAFSLYLAYFP